MPHFAYCCTCQPSRYYLRKFEADSGFLEVRQVDVPFVGKSALYMRLVSNKLYIWDGASSATQLHRYDIDLNLEQSFTAADKYPGNDTQYQFDTNGSDVVMCVKRASAGVADRLESRSATDSTNWTATLDGSTEALYGCCMDSTGNVYAWSSGGGNSYFYKFDSSGTKQWKTTIASSSSFYGIVIDSSGTPWTCSVEGVNDKIRKWNTSGSIAATSTVADHGRIRADSSGGIWMIGSDFQTLYHIDSSAALITSWTDASFFTTHFGVDPSDNVFVQISGQAKIRKKNSSGTTQWTSGTMWFTTGWSAEAANSTHVFVCGGRSP